MARPKPLTLLEEKMVSKVGFACAISFSFVKGLNEGKTALWFGYELKCLITLSSFVV